MILLEFCLNAHSECSKPRRLPFLFFSRIAAPFRGEAYCQAVKNGDAETFNKVFHWYKTERNQVEKGNLMNAITCSRDIITLKKLLLDAMKPEGSSFRLQDCASLFTKVCTNDATSDAMLNFMIDRWDDMMIRYSNRLTTIPTINFISD